MSFVAGMFLNAQIDLYATQSATTSGLANVQTIGCDDLEDAIALGLSIYASLRRHSGAWAADTALGKVSFSWETSRQFTVEFAFNCQPIYLPGKCLKKRIVAPLSSQNPPTNSSEEPLLYR